MAPSPGHLLVPKTLNFIRLAVSQVKSNVRNKASQISSTVRQSAASGQVHGSIPIHPLAQLKQSCTSAHRRWFSSTSNPARLIAKTTERHNLPVSRVSRTIQQRGISPFASTLRPNLTGGAVPRTAGGYSLGGGARYFSHTSGCQAQVLQNVNAGIRAFIVNGGKARFDGVDPVSRTKKWKSVGQAEDKAYRQWQKKSTFDGQQLGTSLDFPLSPTITALRSSKLPTFETEDFGNEGSATLQTPDVLNTLSSDLPRALKDYGQITRDLRLLSRFGALPLSLHHHGTNSSGGSTFLRVRFTGCDGEIVAAMCDEVGIKRGIIREDDEWSHRKNVDWTGMSSLRFPYAPAPGSDIVSYKTQIDEDPPCINSPNRPHDDMMDTNVDRGLLTPNSTSIPSDADISLSNLSIPLSSVTEGDNGRAVDTNPRHPPSSPATHTRLDLSVESYEGVEGIYRFLQECDEAAAAATPLRRRL